MVFLGFHASHEQIPPHQLLLDVQRAEEVGFDGAMCSDHFAPWSPRQGESGHAWSWLGAALATTRFSVGTVTAPGQRYHPAIAAQAIGTLADMFPGRFWAALGSGEALNEHITGDPWPDKSDRNRRLESSADVIRRLLAGEEVDERGIVDVHRARLWTRPQVRPPLYAAAVSARTAAWAAGWAEGLITVAQSPDVLSDVIAAYRDVGGTGPVMLQVHISWAETDAAALAIARDQWRNALVPPPNRWDIEQPEQFDAIVGEPDDADLRETVLISADERELCEQIAGLAGLGFDRLYLHHVGIDQSGFLEASADLLPRIRERT